MTGIPLLMAFLGCIAAMIYLIARRGLHPFLALLATSLALAFVGGIPLREMAGIVGSGFSGVLGSIGIVILLGMLIGSLLEKTGAALKMADCAVRLAGNRRPELALLLVGWVVSIPVFCDSGFVILNPIRKALSARTGRSSVACTIALGTGLLLSHCLIPPTPGPMAAASTLYGTGGLGMEPNLLAVMAVGGVCSILPGVVMYFFTRHLGRQPDFAPPEPPAAPEAVQRKLPGVVWSFAPIVVPVVLMGLSSLLEPLGLCPDLLYFLGQPMLALTVGLLLGVGLFLGSELPDKSTLLRTLTEDTLKTGGPILFITAAGGVLGSVIKNTDLVRLIGDNAQLLRPLGFAFPFLIAAAFKCAHGSSTVAMTTTASIVAPLMATMGWVTPMSAALLTVAIGGGSMLVSHANDSFFWVVTGFGGLDASTGYRTYTVATLLCGVSVLAGVLICSTLLL